MRTPLLLMAGIEAAILFSALYVAGGLICGNLVDCTPLTSPVAPSAAVAALVTFVCLAAMGLYQYHQRLYYKEAAVRILVGSAIACASLAVLFYVVPSLMISSEVASIAVAYALALLLIARYCFVKTVDEHVFRRSTLIYGAGERAASISSLRRKADRRGFKIVGQVPAVGDTVIDSVDALSANGKTLTQLAEECGAEEIVVAMDDRRGNLPIRELLDARFKGIDVIDIVEFLERETGKIFVDLVSPGWLIFAPGFRRSRLRRAAKRILDIVVSGALFLLTWPLMILIAMAIKIEDGIRAPVFYRQNRVGEGDIPFDVLKFRSMSVDAEADGKAVWASENDARITRVGAGLRKTRLDELPQVFNVLVGQMSLVGPRPERPEFVEKLKETIPYYSERHVVKPGVTGWAQLKYSYGASREDALEKLQYDLYYIKNQGIILDIVILLQTVEIVLWGKGAR